MNTGSGSHNTAGELYLMMADLSHFQILDGLGQVRQLDVFDLLGKVYTLERRDGPSWSAREPSLQ